MIKTAYDEAFELGYAAGFTKVAAVPDADRHYKKVMKDLANGWSDTHKTEEFMQRHPKLIAPVVSSIRQQAEDAGGAIPYLAKELIKARTIVHPEKRPPLPSFIYEPLVKSHIKSLLKKRK